MRTIKQINTLPDELTPEEELTLLKKKDTNVEARNVLVERTLKAAIRFTTALTKGRLQLDEAFSISGMALMRAIEKYKLKADRKPVRLLTYAKPYLRSEIARAWRIRDPIDYGALIPNKLSEPEPDLDTVIEDESPGPDFDLIHQHDRMELLKPHFDRLSETEKRILTLQFESRLSGSAVARMLGCTRANIREARNRALKKLRHALIWEKKFDA
jgi:RNA polymerase sigma factor (sigma-70 family)